MQIVLCFGVQNNISNEFNFTSAKQKMRINSYLKLYFSYDILKGINDQAGHADG